VWYGHAIMDFELIIDSHTHWGPSATMGIDVTTKELQRQQEESGVTHVIIMPFPSTAIESNAINVNVLKETKRIQNFIPYHYIRENYDVADFNPIPTAYFGGKWHWMRGVQDSASNYKVLEDKMLPELIEKIDLTEKPVIFEEELEFTRRFLNLFPDSILIIPHLGMLGGHPLDFLSSFKKYENIYFDTALASHNTILEFVKTIGPERVLFGSDVPFGSMKNELSKVFALPISDVDKGCILSKNIMRLAHLSI
jgi:predicted TIM-barrel fold metal-dependent hydrolase